MHKEMKDIMAETNLTQNGSINIVEIIPAVASDEVMMLRSFRQLNRLA